MTYYYPGGDLGLVPYALHYKDKSYLPLRSPPQGKVFIGCGTQNETPSRSSVLVSDVLII